MYITFHLYNIPNEVHPHFTNEETNDQKGYMAYPESKASK